MRTAGIVAAALLMTGGATAVTTGAATAAPSTAQSCYGSSKALTTVNKVWPKYPNWAYTTANCADINVKPNATIKVQACWKNHACNRPTTIRAGQWGTAATDVLNGTKFYLKFSGNVSGRIAY
ncbi:hypothetical protein ACFWZT_14580 [Streptomyces alboflavus]|uniref:hypothetical protein n=1 Tax=Streptomyces alboflavus TaxID=67267 RepID=UPI0036AE703B